SVTADIAGRHTGVVSGLMNAGCQIGGAITASLTPWIAAQYGWVAAFGTGAAIVVVGTAAWAVVDPRRPIEPVETDESVPPSAGGEQRCSAAMSASNAAPSVHWSLVIRPNKQPATAQPRHKNGAMISGGCMKISRPSAVPCAAVLAALFVSQAAAQSPPEQRPAPLVAWTPKKAPSKPWTEPN